VILVVLCAHTKGPFANPQAIFEAAKIENLPAT
jgi:hypothetical protein